MANNPISMSGTKTISSTYTPINNFFFDDSGLFIRAQPSAEQKPQGSISVFPFPNLVQRFEDTRINERSSDSNQSQFVAKSLSPSLHSKTVYPTRQSLSLPSYRRSRHNPKIRPSPLRKVTLSPNGYPDSFETLASNRHTSQLRPSDNIHRAKNLVSDIAQLSLTQIPGSKQSADADSLLELMAELAQETKAWDPNIFMDENFKKLIAQSRPPVLKEKTERYRRHSWGSSRHRKVQHVATILEDIPEVDGVFI
jgi:hypothetical protein